MWWRRRRAARSDGDVPKPPACSTSLAPDSMENHPPELASEPKSGPDYERQQLRLLESRLITSSMRGEYLGSPNEPSAQRQQPPLEASYFHGSKQDDRHAVSTNTDDLCKLSFINAPSAKRFRNQWINELATKCNALSGTNEEFQTDALRKIGGNSFSQTAKAKDS